MEHSDRSLMPSGKLIFFLIGIALLIVMTALGVWSTKTVYYTFYKDEHGITQKHAYAEHIDLDTLKSIAPDTTSLYLYSSHIKDEDLKHLPPRLRKLTLRETPVNGSGFQHLPQSLHELDIQRLKTIQYENLKYLSPFLLTALWMRLPEHAKNHHLNLLPKSIEKLGISGECFLTHEDMAVLKTLPLQELYLDTCLLSAKSYDILVSIPLTKLTLRKSNMTDDTLIRLPRTLEDLTIDNAPSITPEAMKSLVKDLWKPKNIQLYNGDSRTQSFRFPVEKQN